MHVTRKILYAALVLAALALAAPLFLSRGIRVERAVVVRAPFADVFALVEDMDRHARWHPWDMADPSPRVVYGEQRRGVGASYFWSGSHDNHGMLKWVGVDEGAGRLDGLLELGSMGTSEISFRFAASPGGVEVREAFRKEKERGPFMRYFAPLYRAAIARQLEANLARLKRAAEDEAAGDAAPAAVP